MSFALTSPSEKCMAFLKCRNKETVNQAIGYRATVSISDFESPRDCCVYNGGSVGRGLHKWVLLELRTNSSWLSFLSFGHCPKRGSAVLRHTQNNPPVRQLSEKMEPVHFHGKGKRSLLDVGLLTLKPASASSSRLTPTLGVVGGGVESLKWEGLPERLPPRNRRDQLPILLLIVPSFQDLNPR